MRYTVIRTELVPITSRSRQCPLSKAAGCCTKYVLSALHLVFPTRISKPSTVLKLYHFLVYEIQLHLMDLEVKNAFMDFYVYIIKEKSNSPRQYVTRQSVVPHKILRVCAKAVRD